MEFYGGGSCDGSAIDPGPVIDDGLRRELTETGRLILRSRIDRCPINRIMAVADSLGTPVRGRIGTQEALVPVTRVEARPGSLGALHGLGALPYHVEQAHRSQPCRYVVLGCIDPGVVAADTTLVDGATLGLTDAERALLGGAPFLVRSGRRSFYASILPTHGRYIRFDAGCMEPVDERGRRALGVMATRIAASPVQRHRWCRGDVMVLDNWRILHGRDAVEPESGRRMSRVLVRG